MRFDDGVKVRVIRGDGKEATVTSSRKDNQAPGYLHRLRYANGKTALVNGSLLVAVHRNKAGLICPCDGEINHGD